MHRRSQGPECEWSSGSGADAAPHGKGGNCVLRYSAISGVYGGLRMDPLREASSSVGGSACPASLVTRG